MKKALLFFAAFFFFVFLSAEEVQVYEDDNMILWGERWTGQESEPEPEPEVEKPEEQKEPEEAAPEAGQNTGGMECCCDDSRETNENPKKFYIQPALGVGTGASMYRFNLSLDADVLVARTKKINYYIGLDIDARTSALWGLEPKELAVQVNGVFDFIQDGVPELMSASLWISVGIDLIFIRHYEEDCWDDYLTFEYSQAWGFGVDLVFKNYVILKFGVEGIIGIFPDLTIAVGYRF